MCLKLWSQCAVWGCSQQKCTELHRGALGSAAKGPGPVHTSLSPYPCKGILQALFRRDVRHEVRCESQDIQTDVNDLITQLLAYPSAQEGTQKGAKAAQYG